MGEKGEPTRQWVFLFQHLRLQPFRDSRLHRELPQGPFPVKLRGMWEVIFPFQAVRFRCHHSHRKDLFLATRQAATPQVRFTVRFQYHSLHQPLFSAIHQAIRFQYQAVRVWVRFQFQAFLQLALVMLVVGCLFLKASLHHLKLLLYSHVQLLDRQCLSHSQGK